MPKKKICTEGFIEIDCSWLRQQIKKLKLMKWKRI